MFTACPSIACGLEVSSDVPIDGIVLGVPAGKKCASSLNCNTFVTSRFNFPFAALKTNLLTIQFFKNVPTNIIDRAVVY